MSLREHVKRSFLRIVRQAVGRHAACFGWRDVPHLDRPRSALQALVARLASLNYRFTTVTPETTQLIRARSEQRGARSLRDVFGHNLDFLPSILPDGVFQAMQTAGACEPLSNGFWRATLRVSSLGHLLFVHSAFPTLEADAVFFGPDSYRFVRCIQQLGLSAKRAVDIGCGTGCGGIALAHQGAIDAPIVLADVNDRALELAGVNADSAGVNAELVKSDVLRSVDGPVDLIVCNPPYLNDDAGRIYRDGGGARGASLSVRIVRESLARLARDGGGTLLLYTGVAIVDGTDAFFEVIKADLQQSHARYSYEEVDPDIFSSELVKPAYADAERIAAVLLHATLG